MENKKNSNNKIEKTKVSEKLSTLPYKGTTDTYPEEMFYRRYLFNIWVETAKEFGYEEYDTPLIEPAQLYRAKSGDELGSNQLYSFFDKGDREIAIRPEMTPSLARIIAAKRKELLFPLRWFNIGRYYRYEKPQRGRSREFFQLNIDLLGVDTIGAELEIIQFVIAVMEKLKAPKESYELKVNSRYLLDYLLEEILTIETQEKKEAVMKAIDTYLKMESNDFKGYLKELGLDSEQIKNLEDFLEWDLSDLETIAQESRGAKELLDLFKKIDALGISNVGFSPYIVRGLQYYTGTVIEMFDIGSKDNPRAIFGGGRYDNLLEIFEEKNIPAFGLGWGDVTTLNYLKTYNLLPEYKPEIKVFVTLMDDSLFEETAKVAQFLRDNGINTEMELSSTKLGKQLKYANKKSIPWVIIIGEDELKENKVLLKDMKTSNQETLQVQKVLDRVK